jgi:hypothetical protein
MQIALRLARRDQGELEQIEVQRIGLEHRRT